MVMNIAGAPLSREPTTFTPVIGVGEVSAGATSCPPARTATSTAPPASVWRWFLPGPPGTSSTSMPSSRKKPCSIAL